MRNRSAPLDALLLRITHYALRVMRYASAYALHDHRHNHRPLPRPGVEVEQHDLLVLAGEEFAPGEGDGQSRADQGGPDVAVAVVVVPRCFVLVPCVIGDEALQNFRHVVLDQAGLELDGGQGGGGADDEQVEQAVAGEFQVAQALGKLRVKIDNVGVAFGKDVQGKSLHAHPGPSSNFDRTAGATVAAGGRGRGTPGGRRTA